MTRPRIATVGGDVSADRQQAKPGLSVSTLMIASASSLAAALVVSKLWGGGTLIGAAMTPVIVALVSEGLRRPANVIGTVRETRAARFDPVVEGRRGLREGDLERARRAVPAAAAAAERRVHQASARGGGPSLRLPRPRVIAAVVTGLVAFLLAGVFLTGSELVLGKSVVSSSKRTTYIPVHRSRSSTEKDKTDTTSTQDTTAPTTTAPTTTTPPPAATTPTVPPGQETTPAPQTTTPAPGAAPTTPANPAPQSATPPATTP
jgi:hypothetical protein